MNNTSQQVAIVTGSSRSIGAAVAQRLAEQALQGLAALEPADADAIVEIVSMQFGSRPFRRHIDPSQDGCEIVNGVADRVCSEMYRRIGLEDLLSPRVNA